jgi:hypothetical protein
MKLYKVLNVDLTSPYQGFQFELGKKYVCDDFDTSDNECSKGFYAVDFNGLVYAINNGGQKHSVFEVEVGGRSKEFNQFKRRYEEITILRELADDEIKEGLLACEEKEGYRVCEACYPVHPFEVNPMPLEDAKKLLEEWKKVRASVWDSVLASVRVSVWDSVCDSVWASVRDAVRDSVWASVWASVRVSVRDAVRASVWDSIGDSVRASVGAYISSLFTNIEQWKYVKHEAGVNPFQSGINLWKGGYVPSFDGKTWRLHTKDEVVWED